MKGLSHIHMCAKSRCDPMGCSLPGSSVMGFSRQEYWSGLPSLPPEDLLDSGTETASPALADGFLTCLGSPAIHTHSPRNSPPIQAATWHRAEPPMLYSRSLLTIHFRYPAKLQFDRMTHNLKNLRRLHLDIWVDSISSSLALHTLCKSSALSSCFWSC